MFKLLACSLLNQMVFAVNGGGRGQLGLTTMVMSPGCIFCPVYD